MRTDVLQNVLEELKSSSADVEASACGLDHLCGRADGIYVVGMAVAVFSVVKLHVPPVARSPHKGHVIALVK